MPGRTMLLDSASLYFRAFYGVPDTVRSPQGEPVNAIRGLLDIVARLVAEFRPDHLVAAWDDDWRPAWRVDLIPSYKAHRVAADVSTAPGADESIEEVPDLLTPQVPVIAELLGVLGVPVIGAEHCEADDVIGTLTARADGPVLIVTGDRDLFQLIDDARGVRVLSTIKGMRDLEVITAETVRAKYGVGPERYADFATLRGDTSDGLPGVAGIGEKTAAKLLAEFGDLDGIRVAASDASSSLTPRIRASLVAASDYLDVAPRVVRVLADAELPEVGDARVRAIDAERSDRFDELTERWGLGSTAERVRAAFAGTSAG